MANTTRKREKPPAPVAEIDDSFARVMARACLAAADQIQERSITQLSVQWERNSADGFEQTLKSGRDDYGVVGEVHRKAIPERRWQVFYNRQTATYRLEEVDPDATPEPTPEPSAKPKRGKATTSSNGRSS
ncbi:MAG: hypothetical protein ACRDHN_01090 [Thermomicrobiales bacterium]